MAPAKASAKTSATQEKMSKTEICRFNSMGKCKRGAQCSFAHGPEELVAKPDLFKTMLCRKWAKGSCNFTNCTFAHGEEELRDARSKRLTGLRNFDVVAEKEEAILEETCVSEASTEDGGTGTGSASEERMEDHVWGLELLLSAQTAALNAATQDAETRPVFVLPGDAAKFPMKASSAQVTTVLRSKLEFQVQKQI
ncbi:zfp36l2-A [Symbiodinium sp. CCMP2592]|nr:zfp36l2-A [Symbiodinium sp. CCMP2592]